jgi:carnitine 3-dehydrogenase
VERGLRPKAVVWAGEFYKAAGKAPLMMKKEIPGFVATRLQEALWREALHMVANDEATPEDIDNALMNGPGTSYGSARPMYGFSCRHVVQEEWPTNLDQFGPALKLPWTRLEAPELTKELRDRMVNGCNAVAKDKAV